MAINVHNVRGPKVLAKTVDAGNLEVVLIDDLHVDREYQRDLSMDLVQKIAGKWDMVTAGAIVASRRPNSDLFIVNGQHRAAAAKLAGETHILAQVIDGLDRVTEAELRLRGNVSLGDKVMDRFRAQLAAKNPESLAIVRLCESFETKLNTSPDSSTGINCISTIEHLYRLDKGVMLSRVFEIVRQAWKRVEGDKATVPVLKGVAWFLEKHAEEADRNRLVERMQQTGPAVLTQRARAHKAAMGGALWANYYRALVEAYNERLSPAAKLEWRMGGWTSRGTDGSSD